jgi:hypothetical protein
MRDVAPVVTIRCSLTRGIGDTPAAWYNEQARTATLTVPLSLVVSRIDPLERRFEARRGKEIQGQRC